MSIIQWGGNRSVIDLFGFKVERATQKRIYDFEVARSLQGCRALDKDLE